MVKINGKIDLFSVTRKILLCNGLYTLFCVPACLATINEIENYMSIQKKDEKIQVGGFRIDKEAEKVRSNVTSGDLYRFR